MHTLYKYLSSTLLVLLAVSCDLTTEEDFFLLGNIKGEITQYTDLGIFEEDREGILIELFGAEEELITSTTTNKEGLFNLTEVKTGNYEIGISKNGYGSLRLYNVKVLGPENSPIIKTSIVKKSTTKISELDFTISTNSEIIVSGKIEHNYIVSQFQRPSIIIYFDYTSDVSYEKYVYSRVLSLEVLSGSHFEISTNLTTGIFDGGTVVYAKAYGRPVFFSANYNYKTATYKYNSLGEPSNTSFFEIP